MKTKIIAAASLMAVAVVVVAAIVVANPFGDSDRMGGGEESMHTEGMAPLSANAGEERTHREGMAPLTVNVETEKRIVGADPDSRTVSESRAKPYIGVAISEAEGGAVRVVDVLEDGPSNGVLESGDLITAAAGERIGGAKDLVKAIADAGAGAALALTVERDGGETDVSVNVGEFSQDADSGISRYSYSQTFNLPQDRFPAMMDKNILDQFGKMDDFSDFPMMMDKDVLDQFGKDGFADFPMPMMTNKDILDHFGKDGFADFPMMMGMDEIGEIARMEKSVADEDGVYRTHRMASGTVTHVDADAGTFTLQPEDGSDAITYSVSDDAKTFIAGSGGVSGLSADGETPTLVMDIDGAAELILQGETAIFGGK